MRSTHRKNGNSLPISVEEALNHVRFIARQMQTNLPVQVEFDDLVSEGAVGLLQAAGTFDPARNVKFRTYAERRIRGAIQDYLRRLDPLSRTMRSRQREAERAIADLTAKFGRPPKDAEIARRLKLPVKRWRALTQELYEAGAPVNGWRASNEPVVQVECLAGQWRSPEQLTLQNETRRMLNDAIGALPPRYRTVIRLYYGRECTMKEIGRELGVNEGRVSQMHGEAVRRMRAHLECTDAKIKEEQR